MRMVKCTVKKMQAEGLDAPPYPGELGERIYANVSKQGWTDWLTRLTMIINENQLNTSDPRSIAVIEQHMLGFLFDEGDMGSLPAGFSPGGGKK